MDKFKGIKNVAEQNLTIKTPTCKTDTSLLDRAERLVRNTELICKLPEVARLELPMDRLSLYAATYFCDSGYARLLWSHNSMIAMNPGNATEESTDKLCEQLMRRSLGHILSSSELEKSINIIKESKGRFTEIAEAMILSDARNLDDMGLVGIFSENRRYAFEGKGIAFAVDSWQKKIDYKYWQARLKDSFRFESVRQIAANRLKQAESTMEWLKTESQSLDLKEKIAENTTV